MALYDREMNAMVTRWNTTITVELRRPSNKLQCFFSICIRLQPVIRVAVIKIFVICTWWAQVALGYISSFEHSTMSSNSIWEHQCMRTFNIRMTIEIHGFCMRFIFIHFSFHDRWNFSLTIRVRRFTRMTYELKQWKHDSNVDAFWFLLNKQGVYREWLRKV